MNPQAEKSGGAKLREHGVQPPGLHVPVREFENIHPKEEGRLVKCKKELQTAENRIQLK